MCLEVTDVHSSLAALKPASVRVLDPQPKIGAHGNPVSVHRLRMHLRQVVCGCGVANSLHEQQ